MSDSHHNWAGNLRYAAQRVHLPKSVAEAQALVARSTAINAFGARHSFSSVADGAADHISLTQLPPEIEVDRARMHVHVGAGVTYGVLARALHAQGLALHNMASLPHITVGGAVATATHGSGDRCGNLATAVEAIELIAPDGTLTSFARDTHRDVFDGVVVALGALGVASRITLAVQPAFDMVQVVYESLPVDEALASFDQITAGAYSTSLFWDWNSSAVTQVWRKCRVADKPDLPARWHGALRASTHRHPLHGLAPEPCTPQLGEPGPWHERLPHFRMEHTPSNGDELQTEYFVARKHAVAAMRAVQSLHARLAPLLFISEIRTVAADALWLSTAYGRDTVALHFTWKPMWPELRALLPEIEAHLAPFQPRPHWGKLFALPGTALHAAYPRINDFRKLAATLDPAGKFRNAFVKEHVFGA